MSLFAVPGWGVPPTPATRSKKRKRPTTQDHHDDIDLVSTAANIDKLMKQFDDTGGESSWRKRTKDEDKSGGAVDEKKKKRQEKKRKHDKSGKEQVARDPPIESTKGSSLGPSKKGRKEKKQKPSDEALPVVRPSPNRKPSFDSSGLTTLQKSMKDSLDGARFRWINEALYKSHSAEAHKMMQKDPDVFEEYHAGFRHQVQSWPTNPVSKYIVELSTYPERTVIADLGCGDAALAQALIPKGMTVLSYDLVSDNVFVVEADICSKIPLPGSEGEANSSSQGEAQIVDVAICALSLMGTNWIGCIREAWRTLKPGGELRVAEVASRFTEVDEFVSLIGSVGFRLKSKDDHNTHFTLFEFKKIARKVKTDNEWQKLVSSGKVLKPCEYKRR